MTNLLLLTPQVPQLAVKTEASESWGDEIGLNGLSNQRSGQRYTLAKQTNASDRTAISYDLGLNPQAVDYLALARADLLGDISALFLRSSDASFNAPTEMSGILAWLDANQGTTLSGSKVTSWASRVGSYAATQATDANRPVLTRFDNKENLYLYSEEFNNATWTKTRSSITANAVANPINGASDADLLVEDSSASTSHYLIPAAGFTIKPSTSYRISVYAKYKDRHIAIRFDNGWTSNPYAYFNLQTGAVAAVGSGVSASIESVGGGWYRLTATCTSPASPGTAYPSIYLCNTATTQSYTGDGASGSYVWGAQFQVAEAETGYVKTTASPEVRGINGNRGIYFDGTNDYLSMDSLAAAFTGTDKDIGIFMAYRSDKASTVSIASFGRSSSSTPFMVWKQDANRTFATQDDAATAKSHGLGTSDTAVTVWGHGSNGTDAIDQINGVSSSLYDVDVGARTLDRFTIGALGRNSYSDYFFGSIAEIIIYDASVNQTDILAYLTAKYRTAPLVADYAFAPNVGVDGNDYVNKFSASSSSRYFWVEMWSDDNYFTHSKLYIGEALDLGETVGSIKCSRKDRIESFVADSGAVFPCRIRKTPYDVAIEWQGLTDALIQEVFASIGDSPHLAKGLFLYTQTNHEVLDGWKSLHVEVESVSSPRADKADHNTLFAEFTELRE